MTIEPATQGVPPAKTAKSLRAPGPGGLEALRIASRARKDPLGVMQDLEARFGDIVRVSLAGKDIFLISDPAMVKHVLADNADNYQKSVATDQLKPLFGEGLLTSKGAHWRKHRKLLQPVFRAANMGRVLPMFHEETERTLAAWEQQRLGGSPVEITQDGTQLAFRIAGRTFFGADLSTSAAETGTAFTASLEELVHRINSPLRPPLWLPTPRNRRLKRSVERLNELVRGLLAERKAMTSPPDDLLQLLIEARDDDTGERMEDADIVDEMKTFLFAGHETTANSMVWALYLLSHHPLVQERMRAELHQHVAGPRVTVDELKKLVYSGWVVNEAMRVKPPSWRMIRVAIGDDVIGGYSIPAGSLVVLAQFLIHRSPKLWPDPLRFDPERWDPARAESQHRFAFFPLGGGQRLCVANNFAQLEVRLVLALIVNRYQLELVGPPDVGHEPLVTMRPRGEIFVRLSPR